MSSEFFSFDSQLSQFCSIGKPFQLIHLTFCRLVIGIRNMSDIYRDSDHSLLPSQLLYTQQRWRWLFRTGTEHPTLLIMFLEYNKKNWRMIATISAVHSSAIIYTIAKTVKTNNLKPQDYFVYLLEEIRKRSNVYLEANTQQTF